MTEAEWLASDKPNDLVENTRLHKTAWKRGVWGRKMRLVWCHIYRQKWDELPDETFRTALVAAEEYVDKAISLAHFRSASSDAFQTLHWLKSPISEPFVTFLLQIEKSRCDELRYVYHLPGLCEAVRDIFGNPFRPVAFDPAWRTSTAVGLAETMYAGRDFAAMPVLADALQDAGCEHAEVLAHCRDETATHIRGCWVVDLVLGKS